MGAAALPVRSRGPFLASKPAASLASLHDPACNVQELTRGEGGTDRDRPRVSAMGGDDHACEGWGSAGGTRASNAGWRFPFPKNRFLVLCPFLVYSKAT